MLKWMGVRTLRTMGTIMNKKRQQINSERRKRRLIKLAKFRQKLSSFHLSKEEIDKVLKVLKRLGYLKCVRPGVLEVIDDKLWQWLNQNEKIWQPISVIKNHENRKL